MITDGATILFQGDSITDAGRSRNDDRRLGVGYPRFVSERLKKAAPQAIFVLSTGASAEIAQKTSSPDGKRIVLQLTPTMSASL